jgi:hypothetical protein
MSAEIVLLASCWFLAWLILSTMKMEAICPSEMSVNFLFYIYFLMIARHSFDRDVGHSCTRRLMCLGGWNQWRNRPVRITLVISCLCHSTIMDALYENQASPASHVITPPHPFSGVSAKWTSILPFKSPSLTIQRCPPGFTRMVPHAHTQGL